MLQPTDLYDYQRQAILHQLYHPKSMLWLGMGLGKTPITLTTIVDRMRAGQLTKTLVFGPLRVIHGVWAREARKWSHTQHLRCVVLSGTAEQRLRLLFSDADIYLCNYENMSWLAEQLLFYYVNQGLPLPFQFAVYDEISKLKNPQTKRMKGGKRTKKDKRGFKEKITVVGWKKVMEHFTYATGLTGTPAANGYMDLFGQYLAVDNGERLGKFITHFRNAYFASDYMGYDYELTDPGKQWIEHKIADITLKMDKKDYVDMPDVKEINLMVDLPPAARNQYDEMEKDMFTALDSGTEVEVFSRSSVSNKCLQFCNGAPYTDKEGTWEAVHEVKLDALESVLEEAAGQPVLCSYSFKADAERIMKRFKSYKPVNMTATKAKDTEKIIDRWNDGKIKLMIGHPASMGHGIDGLQESGSIVVWFGVNWSLELYSQMNERIDRPGQKHTVQIIRILCNDTIDLAVADSLMWKDTEQQSLKDSIQRYRDGAVTNELEVSFL